MFASELMNNVGPFLSLAIDVSIRDVLELEFLGAASVYALQNAKLSCH